MCSHAKPPAWRTRRLSLEDLFLSQPATWLAHILSKAVQAHSLLFPCLLENEEDQFLGQHDKDEEPNDATRNRQNDPRQCVVNLLH